VGKVHRGILNPGVSLSRHVLFLLTDLVTSARYDRIYSRLGLLLAVLDMRVEVFHFGLNLAYMHSCKVFSDLDI